ncbi:MAG: LysR family transcriptional regulator [Pseudomonadota bacterium]
MQYWNELRTVYLIATHGTATAAANILGVHRTTVMRQLDFLESELQQKLFIRHNKGFTLNESGKVLLSALQESDKKISQSISSLNGEQSLLNGELIITAVERVLTIINEPLGEFLLTNPNLRIRLEPDNRKYQLEFGEAHIAIRVGQQPTEPDYVVSHLGDIKLGLYAAKSYINRLGLPENEADFIHHQFAVAQLPVKNVLNDWFDRMIKPENVIFSCEEPSIVEKAVVSGIGIGIVMHQHAIKNPELVEIIPSTCNWHVPMWLITHGDQHRVPKVRACTSHLREWAKRLI